MQPSRAALLLILLTFGGSAHAAVLPVKPNTITDPCQSLTKIPGCIECKRGRGPQSPAGATHRCLYCTKDRAQNWSTDKMPNTAAGVPYIRSCPTTIADVARCKQLTGIDNCAKCWESGAGPWWSPKGTNGKWCTLCVSGFYFNWNVNSANFGKCMPGNCQQTSGNSNCVQCNPDKSCTKCKTVPGQKTLLMPKNAIFTNGNYGESMCVTPAQLTTYSRQVNGGNNPPALPGNCTEVGTDMQCARCVDNYALTTPSSCFPMNSAQGSRCTNPRLSYRQYCAKCFANNPNACQTCVYARGFVGSSCALNCKTLFGIGCATCTRAKCTGIDSFYPFGRR